MCLKVLVIQRQKERELLLKVIGQFVEAEVENAMGDEELKVEIIITGKMMTDAEVEALPEC